MAKRTKHTSAAIRENLTANNVKAMRNNRAGFTTVQAKVRAIMPRIVHEEVARSVGAFFAL